MDRRLANASRAGAATLLMAVLSGVAAATSGAATSHSAAPVRSAADLTPAQQCVRDGHLIPTVGKSTKAALKSASSTITVGGWAFLDSDTPVVGARIRIVDGRGKTVKLLGPSTSKTGPSGTFLVAVRKLPKTFKILASGGRQSGKAFHGTLSASGTRGTQYVSPVTTIIDAYRAAHPARKAALVVSAVKQTLGIPASANLTTDLRFTNHLFDAQKFLAHGPFDRTVRRIVRTVQVGGKQLFRGQYGPSGIGTDLLKWGGKQLANGAVSYLGGLGMGWLLGAAGITEDATAKQLDEIKGSLDQINNRLTEIGQQLKDLNGKADQQLLATTVVSLRAARTAITGKSADIKYIAQMASVPHDKAYLESKACATLADLYPLASGTADYGYAPDLINGAFFPEPGVVSLTQAFINVVKTRSRWFSSASSDEIAQMVQYWTGIEMAWAQIKLEWEHAVHPCPLTPTPTAANCDAVHWAARYVSDTSAQIDTLPLQVPSGVVIDMNTRLGWGPAYGDNSFLAHPPPAGYADTFGPKGDWMRTLSGPGAGPTQACSAARGGLIPDPLQVSLCAVALKSHPGPFRSPWEWWPPTAEQLNALIAGSKNAGFNSPLDYLTMPWSDGGAGFERAWFDQGGDKLWMYGCCSALDLTTGGTVAPSQAGFLLTSQTPVSEPRYWASGGSTQFGGADPRIRYVESSGSDTTATGASNSCRVYLQPCKTVTHAVAVSGYAILVRIGGGTFTGPLTLERDITLVGAGAGLTSIDGGGAASAVTIAEPIGVEIDGATITGGKVAGIDTEAGSLTLADSTVAGNSGSGIENKSRVTVLRSTIGPNAQWGVANWGSSTAERATIVNSTISGNTYSGLIANATGGPGSSSSTLINATVAGNGGSGVSGGRGANKIQLTNTILSNQNCLDALEAGPGGHNLITDLHSCTFDAKGSAGNLTGVDAKLGPLMINGGPTSTMAFLLGSPAVGAGDAATCAAAQVGTLDQRSYIRPSGSCDMGAYDSKAVNQPVAG
jgi:hypothetical protein